ncbi:hypothetical protein C8R44DRAFT_991904 [Mycena epipterygia]|nr:hypothetical protein C8R44DRAFT_991904 [Mycena epipterygia]
MREDEIEQKKGGEWRQDGGSKARGGIADRADSHGHLELPRSLLLAPRTTGLSLDPAAALYPNRPIDFSPLSLSVLLTPLDSPHGLHSPLHFPAHNIHSPSHSLHSASHSHSLHSPTHAMHAAALLVTPSRFFPLSPTLPSASRSWSWRWAWLWLFGRSSGAGGVESLAYQQQPQQLRAQQAQAGGSGAGGGGGEAVSTGSNGGNEVCFCARCSPSPRFSNRALSFPFTLLFPRCSICRSLPPLFLLLALALTSHGSSFTPPSLAIHSFCSLLPLMSLVALYSCSDAPLPSTHSRLSLLTPLPSTSFKATFLISYPHLSTFLIHAILPFTYAPRSSPISSSSPSTFPHPDTPYSRPTFPSSAPLLAPTRSLLVSTLPRSSFSIPSLAHPPRSWLYPSSPFHVALPILCPCCTSLPRIRSSFTYLPHPTHAPCSSFSRRSSASFSLTLPYT